MRTAAQRKASERDRKRQDGLKRFEVWVRPDIWPKILRYIERLMK